MTADERHATYIVSQMEIEYKGLFAGFQPIREPKPRLAAAPVSEGPKPPKLAKPKASKKCLKEARKLSKCIEGSVGSDRSEPVVKTATEFCLCGTYRRGLIH